MRRAAHIAMLVLLATLCACGRGTRVIPPEKFSRLYFDMFLADQWLRDNSRERPVADTTLFFDPIFRRHHVTFEEYDRSVQYYLDRPEQFEKILSRTGDRLEKEGLRMQQEVDALAVRQHELDRYRRSARTFDFETDSSRWAYPDRLWPAETEDTTTTTPQAYGLSGEIQLRPEGGERSKADSNRFVRIKEPGPRRGAEKVLLPDGPDHLTAQ